MENIITKLANKFGFYTKDQLTPVINNKDIQILQLEAELRPTYQELVQLPDLTNQSIKRALIRSCKLKLFEEIENYITIEETRDENGIKLKSNLQIIR